MPDGSFAFRTAFVALVLAVAGGLVLAVWRAGGGVGDTLRERRRVTSQTALGVGLWLAFTVRLAATGFLTFEPRPTLLPLLALGLLGTVLLAFSRFGARLASGLPIALLVGYQGFRIPLELLLHRGVREGLVPVQMTYLGMNFDLLTGILALLLALLSRLGPLPRLLIAVWNLIGFGLLSNVVTIALLSAPTPLRVFMNEPANVWITRAPWVWLPTVLVPAALLGHLLVLRWLFANPGAQRPGAATPGPAGGVVGGSSRGR
jgi:hypothetical protein